MKIIFENFIQDYDVLAFKYRDHRMLYEGSSISGELLLSRDIYNKIEDNPRNLLSKHFSIVSNNLKPFYQTCYISSIRPLNNVIGFSVIDVGKSSIAIPEEEYNEISNRLAFLQFPNRNYYSNYTTNTVSNWSFNLRMPGSDST